MKKLFITIFMLSFLSSCSLFNNPFLKKDEELSIEKKLPVITDFKEAIEKALISIFKEEQRINIMKTAELFKGLQEVKDRQKLKDFLDVDPVNLEWCAAFVNSVLKENSIEGTNSLAARSFIGWGEEVQEPKYGDIVVFPRQGWKGHVGFYVDSYTDNKGNLYYLILGGNQDDEVNYSRYLAKEAISIRRPPLSNIN